MPGQNEPPNADVAEVLGFNYNIVGDNQHVINEFDANSASTFVTHFAKRQFGTNVAVKWNPADFPE